MSDQNLRTILMLVFSEVKHDGRVLRAAEALSREYNVILVGLGGCSIRSTVPIRYLQVSVPSGPRWLRHALFFVKTMLIGLRERPEILHAHDYFVVLHGWLIAWLIRAACIYDAHEFLPGIKERSQLRHGLFMLLERLAIKRYDLVITTGEERAQALKDYYGLKELPVVVKNFAGVENEILESNRAEQPTNYHFQDALRVGLPVVIYQGSMDVRSRCLDNLVRAFTDLQDKCVLIMAGDGPDLGYLRRLSADLGLERRVIFTGKIPRGQLVSVMRAASIGVVIYSSEEVNNLICSPNKIHEYAQAGLPIVASNQPPLLQMLNAYPIGELFDPEESVSIQQAILNVLSNLGSYKARIPGFLAHYNWDNEKMKLLDAYKSLMFIRLLNGR